MFCWWCIFCLIHLSPIPSLLHSTANKSCKERWEYIAIGNFVLNIMVKTRRRKRIKVEEENEGHADEYLPPATTNASALEQDQDPHKNCDPGEARKRPRRASKVLQGQTAEDVKSPLPRTRTRKRQREVINGTVGNHSDVGSQSDGDDSRRFRSKGETNDDAGVDGESDEPEESTKSGGKWKRSPESPKGRGAEADRTCGHCGKVIVSVQGLKYHVGRCFVRTCVSAVPLSNELIPSNHALDNFVCRKESMPEKLKRAPAPSKKRKKSIVGRPKVKESSRFRGSVEDRTCPKCKKVFTSVLGKNYHVSK